MPHFSNRLDLRYSTAPTGKRSDGGTAKGGGRSFRPYEREIRRVLTRARHDDHVTTLLDFYCLPADTPVEPPRPAVSAASEVVRMEQELASHFNDPRVRPFFLLHEFEALLFADFDVTASGLDVFIGRQREEASALMAFQMQSAPEDINRTPRGAPSKRLERAWPGYAGRKAELGPSLAERIGLPKLRQRCPHFATWLHWLESLA
jgi:hypothetical protein